MNIVSDPSFELNLPPPTGWQYFDLAARYCDVFPAYTGDCGAWIRSVRSPIGSNDGSIREDGLLLVPGEHYFCTVRTHLPDWNQHSGGQIKFRIDQGDGNYIIAATKFVSGTPLNTWELWEPWGFRALGATGRVGLEVPKPPSDGSVDWLVDDVVVEAMPSKRREIKEAVITTLQTINGGPTYFTAPDNVLEGPQAVRHLQGALNLVVSYGPEVKSRDPDEVALARKKGELELLVDIYYRGADGDNTCDDAAADVEKVLETPVSATLIGLGYVHEITVINNDPVEETSEAHRDFRHWRTRVLVDYQHDRGDP